MDLATFGAILSFALELEEQAADFYTKAARGRLKDPFTELAKASQKRIKLMERTRREGVTEMILEPISGLDGDDYQVELSPSAEETDLLKQAIEFEENVRRYYQDAGQKLPIREVVRTFMRMSKENEKRRSELEGL